MIVINGNYLNTQVTIFFFENYIENLLHESEYSIKKCSLWRQIQTRVSLFGWKYRKEKNYIWKDESSTRVFFQDEAIADPWHQTLIVSNIKSTMLTNILDRMRGFTQKKEEDSSYNSNFSIPSLHLRLNLNF